MGQEIKTITVKLPEEEKFYNDLAKKEKNKTIIFHWIAIIILLLSALRIPYTFMFLDAIFFDFLFGNVKFIIYAFLILFLLSKIYFKAVYSYIKTFKFITGILLFSLCICIIFSIVDIYFVHSNADETFGELNGTYINDWLNNSLKGYMYDSFIYFSGGIIGVFVYSGFISSIWVALLVLCGIFIAFSFVLMLNKNNKTFFKKIAQIAKRNKNESSAVVESDTHVVYKTAKLRDISDFELSSSISSPTPQISFLDDTSIIDEFNSLSEAKNIVDRLKLYFKKTNYNVVFNEPIAMPLYKIISFKTSNITETDAIVKNNIEICKVIGINAMNIDFKAQNVTFEIPNTNFSRISIKKVLENMNNPYSKNICILGIDKNEKAVELDMKSGYVNFVFGSLGSGINMLCSVCLTTYFYLNSFENSEVMIFKNNDKKMQLFETLPQVTNFIAEENTFDELKKLHSLVDERAKLLKDSDSEAIFEYNGKNPPTKLKTLLVVIPNFDKFIEDSNVNAEITAIISKAKLACVNFLLFSNSLNSNMASAIYFKKADNKIVLKLSSEYESLLLLDSYKALQLFGNGDGIIIDNEGEKTRFQSCFLNQNELMNILNIITKFYAKKEEISK